VIVAFVNDPIQRNKNTDSILLDKKTAAEALAISVRMVEKLVRRGDLASVRIGDRVLFRRDDLIDFVVKRCARLRGRYEEAEPVGWSALN
jgi:excisionase family DNA binding protein